MTTVSKLWKKWCLDNPLFVFTSRSIGEFEYFDATVLLVHFLTDRTLLGTLLVTSAAARVLPLLSSHTSCSAMLVSLTLLRSRVYSQASPKTSWLGPSGASRTTLGILASSSNTGCPSLPMLISPQLSLATSDGLSSGLLVGLATLMVLG